MTQQKKELIMLMSAITGGGVMGAMLDKMIGKKRYPYNTFYKYSSLDPEYIQILKLNMGIEKSAMRGRAAKQSISGFQRFLRRNPKDVTNFIKRTSGKIQKSTPYIKQIIESTGDIASTIGTTIKRTSDAWKNISALSVPKKKSYAKWIIPSAGAGALGGAYIHSKLSEQEAP